MTKDQYHHSFWKFSATKCGAVFRLDAFGRLIFLKMGSAYFLFGVRIV